MEEIKLNLDNLTEKEQKRLMKLIEKGSQKFKPYKPNKGDSVFYIDENGVVCNKYYSEDTFDELKYKIGNLYASEEECRFAIEKRKVEIELQRFAEENNKDEFDITDPICEKFYYYYDLNDNEILIESYNGSVDATISFSSENIANQAIGIVGEDRIKKYIFGL